MQDAALFFRHRAYGCFMRRRKYPLLSDAWRQEVEAARRFIRACRDSWDDQPHDIMHSYFALGPRRGVRRLDE